MDITAKSGGRQDFQPLDRVLTIAEVCQVLGICRRTFYNDPPPTVKLSARRRGERWPSGPNGSRRGCGDERAAGAGGARLRSARVATPPGTTTREAADPQG